MLVGGDRRTHTTQPGQSKSISDPGNAQTFRLEPSLVGACMTQHSTQREEVRHQHMGEARMYDAAVGLKAQALTKKAGEPGAGNQGKGGTMQVLNVWNACIPSASGSGSTSTRSSCIGSTGGSTGM